MRSDGVIELPNRRQDPAHCRSTACSSQVKWSHVIGPWNSSSTYHLCCPIHQNVRLTVISHRRSGTAFLPHHPLTSQGLGVRVIFLPGLFDQTNWVIPILPGVQGGQSKSGPPDLIEKANRPIRMGSSVGDKAITRRFLAIQRIGARDPVCGPFPAHSQPYKSAADTGSCGGNGS
jgi:hypothetical protein